MKSYSLLHGRMRPFLYNHQIVSVRHINYSKNILHFFRKKETSDERNENTATKTKINLEEESWLRTFTKGLSREKFFQQKKTFASPKEELKAMYKEIQKEPRICETSTDINDLKQNISSQPHFFPKVHLIPPTSVESRLMELKEKHEASLQSPDPQKVDMSKYVPKLPFTELIPPKREIQEKFYPEDTEIELSSENSKNNSEDLSGRNAGRNPYHSFANLSSSRSNQTLAATGKRNLKYFTNKLKANENPPLVHEKEKIHGSITDDKVTSKSSGLKNLRKNNEYKMSWRNKSKLAIRMKMRPMNSVNGKRSPHIPLQYISSLSKFKTLEESNSRIKYLKTLSKKYLNNKLNSQLSDATVSPPTKALKPKDESKSFLYKNSSPEKLFRKINEGRISEVQNKNESGRHCYSNEGNNVPALSEKAYVISSSQYSPAISSLGTSHNHIKQSPKRLTKYLFNKVESKSSSDKHVKYESVSDHNELNLLKKFSNVANQNLQNKTVNKAKQHSYTSKTQQSSNTYTSHTGTMPEDVSSQLIKENNNDNHTQETNILQTKVNRKETLSSQESNTDSIESKLEDEWFKEDDVKKYSDNKSACEPQLTTTYAKIKTIEDTMQDRKLHPEEILLSDTQENNTHDSQLHHDYQDNIVVTPLRRDTDSKCTQHLDQTVSSSNFYSENEIIYEKIPKEKNLNKKEETYVCATKENLSQNYFKNDSLKITHPVGSSSLVPIEFYNGIENYNIGSITFDNRVGHKLNTDITKSPIYSFKSSTDLYQCMSDERFIYLLFSAYLYNFMYLNLELADVYLHKYISQLTKINRGDRNIIDVTNYIPSNSKSYETIIDKLEIIHSSKTQTYLNYSRTQSSVIPTSLRAYQKMFNSSNRNYCTSNINYKEIECGDNKKKKAKPKPQPENKVKQLVCPEKEPVCKKKIRLPGCRRAAMKCSEPEHLPCLRKEPPQPSFSECLQFPLYQRKFTECDCHKKRPRECASVTKEVRVYDACAKQENKKSKKGND